MTVRLNGDSSPRRRRSKTDAEPKGRELDLDQPVDESEEAGEAPSPGRDVAIAGFPRRNDQGWWPMR
ncbi:hypothetical protein [Amycolatopsis cihanbeyliensis]|uniref:hypothetical protein n=1 Tax=Amycolatopsis cihanbeyliensis TaxID=1128664 RepID=UPI001153BF38|nr:hypothetical protein [Amycolatopsis cihanbeyliensis]